MCALTCTPHVPPNHCGQKLASLLPYPKMAQLQSMNCPDGFRKIPLIGSDGSSDQRMDVAQFYHMNFMRDQEQRLSSIKRKVSPLDRVP